MFKNQTANTLVMSLLILALLSGQRGLAQAANYGPMFLEEVDSFIILYSELYYGHDPV